MVQYKWNMLLAAYNLLKVFKNQVSTYSFILSSSVRPNMQNQPSIGIPIKRSSEKKQQTCRSVIFRTPFNKKNLGGLLVDMQTLH